jgi:hypothetical protein
MQPIPGKATQGIPGHPRVKWPFPDGVRRKRKEGRLERESGQRKSGQRKKSTSSFEFFFFMNLIGLLDSH